MISSKISMDSLLEGKMSKIKQRVAKAIVNIVLEEFNHMIKNAPQRYGNFVANFRIAPGLRAGRGAPDMVFPTDTAPEQWFARGQMPAIEYALAHTKDLVPRMTSHITRTSGWMSGMTVYNKLDYAEQVEGYTETVLRAENKGAAHPVTKMEARLAARAARRLVYDSPEFNKLAGE